MGCDCEQSVATYGAAESEWVKCLCYNLLVYKNPTKNKAAQPCSRVLQVSVVTCAHPVLVDSMNYSVWESVIRNDYPIVRLHMRACGCACLRTCRHVRARERRCARAHARTCVRACVRACVDQ